MAPRRRPCRMPLLIWLCTRCADMCPICYFPACWTLAPTAQRQPAARLVAAAQGRSRSARACITPARCGRSRTGRTRRPCRCAPLHQKSLLHGFEPSRCHAPAHAHALDAGSLWGNSAAFIHYSPRKALGRCCALAQQHVLSDRLTARRRKQRRPRSVQRRRNRHAWRQRRRQQQWRLPRQDVHYEHVVSCKAFLNSAA